MLGERRPNPAPQNGHVKIGVVSGLGMHVGTITCPAGQYTFRIADLREDIQKGTSVQFRPVFGGMAASVRKLSAT
jgi:hypothetical protein